MLSHKYNAIVLKRINLGEADRIITAFSFENGKIKFVGKGVRRTKSKLAGSVEPFCLVELNISTGRSLDILTSAHIKKNYLGLTPELEKVKFCSFIAEAIDKLIPEETPVPNIFTLTEQVLSNIDDVDLDLLKIFFLTELFNFLGIYPEKSFCVKCGKKPDGVVYISKSAGGILDEECCFSFSDSHTIDVKSVKILNFSSHHSVNSLKNLNVPKENILEALNFLESYLKHTTGKNFKSEMI